MAVHIGKQSVKLDFCPVITAAASTVGTKEGEGPLKEFFDEVLEDNSAGQESWEKAESEIARRNILLAIRKAGLSCEDIDYILTGDLLNQCCGSTYGIRDMGIPYFGVFGACSTMGEAMGLGALLIDGGGARRVVAAASSHFCSAEKQFRFPLALGTQRPQTSTWTVTGDGAVVLENKNKGVKITAVTTGKIVDMGITDANNMGAAMAPAAADLIECNLRDFGVSPDYYDVIATGDLGYVGRSLVCEMLEEKGIRLGERYIDCGIEIFDREGQDTHSGGSGCACSAVVFAGMLYKKLQRGEIKRMLFVPTGALMSPTSVGQGESIAGIAHGVVIESEAK
jgi:stage V sporulation protein AD